MRHFSTSFPVAVFSRSVAMVGLVAAPLFGAVAQRHLQPDFNFGTSGSVNTALEGQGRVFSQTTLEQATTAADLDFGHLLQANGRLWVCGGRSNSFLVKRYLLDGTPDAAFGTNGSVTTAFPSNAKATGMAMQPDGKVVVVGTINYGTLTTMAVARYTAAGVLDASFGTGGIVYGSDGMAPGTSPSPAVELRRVAILANGNILAAGGNENSVYDTRLLRLLPSGQPDTSFGASSSAYVFYPDRFQEMAVQPDGRILLLGNEARSLNPAGRLGTAVRRLTSTGAADASFGTAGRVVLHDMQPYQGQPTAAFTELLSAAVQPTDGKIVLAGWAHRLTSSSSIGTAAVLQRLNANGTPDAAFNTAAAGSIGHVAGLQAVGLDAAGRPVVGGSVSPFAAPGNQLLLARFTAAGALDTTFARPNASGRVQPGLYAEALPSSVGTVRQLNIQPDGKVLAFGGFGAANSLLMSRYGFARPTGTRAADAALLGLSASPVPAGAGPVTLRYTLPTATSVSLTVRDGLGRLAAPAVRQHQAAGAQQYTIDARSLAPGLYLCTLEAGALRQTTRLVVTP